MIRVTIVVPWFGDYCRGGAETLTRDIYGILENLECDVEIATTTVRDFSADWSQRYYPEGITSESGYKVRRFDPTPRDSEHFDAINARLLHGNVVTEQEDLEFIHNNIRSLKLNQYISSGTRDVYMYIPYVYGTTLFGLMSNREKNILVPLLHDESYAHLRFVQRSLRLADNVVFVSEAERDVWTRLLGEAPRRQWVIPVPVSPVERDTGCTVNPHFQRYVLYAGRKDTNKNVQFVFDVLRHVRTDIGCVLIGGGKLEIPTDIAGRVYDAGYVSEQAKSYLMKNAICLMQPSRYESFGIVAAEASMEGTPVIVNSRCEVLRQYVDASGGGIHTESVETAARQVEEWSNNEVSRQEAGERGASYAVTHFALGPVTQQYRSMLQALSQEAAI